MALIFSIPEYIKLKNFDKLSETAVNLLHLISEYGRKHRVRNEVIVHLVDDQLQMIKKDTHGVYQIYFYINLFNPLDNSGILSEKNLNKRTIEKLLNEILSTNRRKMRLE